MALSDLASLNLRILAQTDTNTEDLATSAFNTDTTEGATGPEDKPDEFRGFSVTDKLGFEQVVNWIITNAFAGSASGKTTAIDAFANNWGARWRESQGLDITDQITRTPTLQDLLDTEGFLNGALWLPLTSQSALPPVFESSQVQDDGTEVPAVATSSLMDGVQFIEITPDLTELKKRPETLFEVVKRSGTDLIRRAMGGGVGTQDEVAKAAAEPTATPQVNASTGFTTGTRPVLNLPDYAKTAIAYSDPASEGRVAPLPRISQTDLIQQLTDTITSGTRGGGGGGGRRDFVADEDQLRANVSDLWSRWLREAPNDAGVDSIVSEYVNEASSFWRDKGGQLDFGTFVQNKLRSMPRYQLLYRNKPPEVSEEQYVASFGNPITQLGLRPELASDEVTRSILSGGSPEGQFQRVSRTREATQGGMTLSQRFAQTLSGLG